MMPTGLLLLSTLLALISAIALSNHSSLTEGLFAFQETHLHILTSVYSCWSFHLCSATETSKITNIETKHSVCDKIRLQQPFLFAGPGLCFGAVHFQFIYIRVCSLSASAGLYSHRPCTYSVQLAPLDKILALLESVAMFYIAYPAAEATGKVLLQTAPPAHAKSMEMLRRGLQDVSVCL